MTRDEVVKGLEAIVADDKVWQKADYYAMVCKDALALLKDEPKRGRWVIGDNGEWACSECGYEPVVFENTPFCANCSARMCDAKKKEGRA